MALYGYISLCSVFAIAILFAVARRRRRCRIPTAASSSGEAILLIHGTFAQLSADEQAKEVEPSWWTPGSAFSRSLHTALADKVKCWPEDLCHVLPWYKRGIAFVWSGHNSEADRQRAGAILLEGLLAFDANNVGYHLVGHSYGGAVIWNALCRAERLGKELKGLRSWSLMGSPFPEYMGTPLYAQWLSLIFVIAFLVLLSSLYRYAPIVPFLWMFLCSLSIITYVSIVVVFLIGVWGLLEVGAGFKTKCCARSLQSNIVATWKKYAACSLILCAPDDEAIAALNNSIGLYFRIPRSRHLWSKVGLLARLIELPLNYIARVRAQGSVQFGHILRTAKNHPIANDVNNEIPLPGELSAAFASAESSLSAKLAFSPFVDLSRMSTTGMEAFQYLFKRIDCRAGLIHTSYYNLDIVNKMIARNIAIHSRLCDDLTGANSAPSDTLDAYCDNAAAGIDPTAVRCDSHCKSIDAIPASVRAPWAVAALVVMIITWYSVDSDRDNRFVPMMIRDVVMPESPQRSAAIAELDRVGEVGQQRLIEEAIAVALRNSDGGAQNAEAGLSIEVFFRDSPKPPVKLIIAMALDPKASAKAKFELISLVAPMGAKAAPAVPSLLAMASIADDPKLVERCLYALGEIGPTTSTASWEIERIAATNSSATVKKAALAALKKIDRTRSNEQ